MGSETKTEGCTVILEQMSADELRVLAKKVGLRGYSSLCRADLVHRLLSDPTKLDMHLCPSWWHKYHNHVYGLVGVLGLLLTVLPLLRSDHALDQREANLGKGLRVVASIENPIRFSDFAGMTPRERAEFLASRMGQHFVWEGYPFKAIGFELGQLSEVTEDQNVGLQITPSKSRSPQLSATFAFGVLGFGDRGSEIRFQLPSLKNTQRIRISGNLSGSIEMPVFDQADLDAVFPAED